MILNRLTLLAARLRGSLWLIPSLMTLTAVGLALFTVWLDSRILLDWSGPWFLIHGGAEGARGVLSTIAGSIITVTGVVFSITIVALQLASTQYTPRVLRSFTEDRATQAVLGVFIATFTYSLLILRAVRSELEDSDRFVPGFSISIAMLLALASVGALIYFVNHIARSIRVEAVLARITSDVLRRIETLFPETIVDGEHRDEGRSRATGEPWAIAAAAGGYLQYVDHEALRKLATTEDLFIHQLRPAGTFFTSGDAMALVHGKRGTPGIERKLRAAFHLGSGRTLDQDIGRGLVELTDIALRALSPGINDPTTAVNCIDRLTEILLGLCRRRPAAAQPGEDGQIRVVAAHATFDEMVRVPYAQLRHFGAGQPVIAHRLIESLRRLLQEAPDDRVRVVEEELQEVLIAVRRRIDSEREIRRLELAAGVE